MAYIRDVDRIRQNAVSQNSEYWYTDERFEQSFFADFEMI